VLLEDEDPDITEKFPRIKKIVSSEVSR
jgi:hypothetical protein